ncbi:MAG: type 4a pilus biogenesis protein PilO [Candidatus Wallbacteria bacterium]|nr:type 4a pilus biogenesis protein PilO [Candidatus Wallbacteria bacterium]
MGEKSLIFTLFLLILIGMCSTFYFKNYKKYVKEKDDLLAEIKRIEEELERAKNIDEQIAAANKELEAILKKMVQLFNKVQTEIRVPVILNKIEEFAKQTKVDFKEIKFENITEYEAYSVMPVTITMVGEYHPLGRFTARLENFKLVTARKGRLTLATTGSGGDAGYANLGQPGYEGLGQLKKKTEITMTFQYEVYKFAKGDFTAAESAIF